MSNKFFSLPSSSLLNTSLNSKKAFTLIELLVVIVIIGILATLATVALSSARVKARDARRVSDVRQIQTALELFFNDQGSYPSTAAVMPSNAITTSGGTYMAKIPGNPTPFAESGCPAAQNVSQYIYAQVNSGLSYSLTYCLGGSTGSIPAGVNTATPSGITAN